MRTPGPITTTCAGLVLAVICVVIWRGPLPGGIDNVWERLFGSADPGPLDVTKLEDYRTEAAGMACPKDICSGPVDIESPNFQVPAERLRDIVSSIASEESNAVLIERTAIEPYTDRYIIRSTVLRLPDTVTVRYIVRSAETSSLVILAQPQVEVIDFGGNRDRVHRWVAIAAQRAGIGEDELPK